MHTHLESSRLFVVAFSFLIGLPFCLAQSPCHIRSVNFSPTDFRSCEIPATADFLGSIDLDSTPVLLDTRVSSTDFRQSFNLNFQTGNNTCRYVLKISGSFSVWSNPTELMDARFRFHPINNDSLKAQGPEGLVIPTPVSVQPSGYNPDHVYWFYYEGNGQNIPIRFTDSGQYSDNSGNLTFEWFAIPCFETTWTFEGSDFDNVNQLSLNFQNPVNAPLRLRVIDLLTGCFKETSTNIRVSEAPMLSILTENSCPDGATGFALIIPNGGLLPYQFSWSHGNGDVPIAENLSPGMYQITVTDGNGCQTTEAFKIEPVSAPQLDFQTQPASCSGLADGRMEILNPQPDWSFSLDGISYQTAAQFEDLAAGIKNLFLQDASGCVFPYTFEIESLPAIQLDLQRQMDVKTGDLVSLDPKISGGSGDFQFSWQPADGLSCADCPNPTFTADDDRSLSLTVTDKLGCQASATIFIKVEKVTGRYAFVPTAFSPNYDGLNDVLTVFGNDNIGKIKSFRVFDRWGSLLFENTDFEPNSEINGWNGETRNKKAPNGIYAWTATLLWADGVESFMKGDVMLVR